MESARTRAHGAHRCDPGDDYVDFVGIEAFDMYPPLRDEAAWDARCASPTGLCSVIEFAREHGKQVGIAEWGVISCGENGGGDNPFFVQKMFETFAANSDIMGFESYFEDTTDGVCSALLHGTENPEASARYRGLYGPR